jgi:hypothetical protein
MWVLLEVWRLASAFSVAEYDLEVSGSCPVTLKDRRGFPIWASEEEAVENRATLVARRCGTQSTNGA